jgi:hemoglobin
MKGVSAMRRFVLTLALACASFFFYGAAVAQAGDALYRAFGEKAGIQSLVENFYDRLKIDARTAPFFKDTNRAHVVEQLTEQLCQLSGGPCVYKGAPMDKVHRDLEIGKRDFNALVEVLQDSMDAKGIAFRDQNRMLALLAPMHRDIVTK